LPILAPAIFSLFAWQQNQIALRQPEQKRSNYKVNKEIRLT